MQQQSNSQVFKITKLIIILVFNYCRQLKRRAVLQKHRRKRGETASGRFGGRGVPLQKKSSQRFLSYLNGETSEQNCQFRNHI